MCTMPLYGKCVTVTVHKKGNWASNKVVSIKRQIICLWIKNYVLDYSWTKKCGQNIEWTRHLWSYVWKLSLKLCKLSCLMFLYLLHIVSQADVVLLLKLFSGWLALKEKIWMHGLEQRIVYTFNRVVYLQDG